MKLLKWKINEKWVAVIAILCLVVLCLLPLLLIGKYDHPCADDFGYGYDTHIVWKSTHSLAETLKTAVHIAHYTYYSWQGTFSSIFLMSLTPVVFGEQYYAIVPYLMLGILVISVFYLSKVLVHNILKGSMANSLILSSILLFMIIEGIYTPASAFFWYNSAVHYTFMQAVMLLMVAFSLRSITAPKRGTRIVTCMLSTFCAFVVSGGNYVNALIGIVLMVFITGLFIAVYLYVKRMKKTVKERMQCCRSFYLLFFPLVVYIIGFVINVSAPGNAIRGSNFADTSAVTAILRSFASGFQYCGEWMSLFTFVLLILALPAVFAVTDKTGFRFKWPLLVLIFSFCVFSATFTSNHYSMGSAGLPRTFNNCKMLYHILLMFNEVYIVGWLRIRISEMKKEGLNKFIIGHGLVFYVIVSLALAGIFLSCDNKEAYYPSYASAKYMHQGFALYYHIQYLERINLMNGPETIVYLPEIAPKLNVLYVDDITTNQYDWRNQHYARWYGKEAVILVPREN